jgi:outer membrane receptor for ferrienterochelin and colicins
MSAVVSSQSLRGTVSDAATGKAIAYATVSDKVQLSGTVTGADGSFELKTSGQNVRLFVSHKAYRAFQVDVRVQADTTLALWLNPIVENLDTITVYGRYFTRLVKNTPRQVRVINSETIRNSGSNDMKDVLQNLIPGLDVSYSNFIPLATYNGMQAKYLLFLVDGQRMAGESFGNADYYRLSPDNIERIEVSDGADGALFGSNAVAGVVNIVTKQKNKGTSADLYTQYGTYNTITSGANLFYPIAKNLRGSTSLEYFGTQGYEVFDSLKKKVLNVEQPPMNTGSVSQRIQWNPGGKWDASLSMAGYFRFRADRSVKHVQYAFADGNFQGGVNYTGEKFTNKFSINGDQYRGYEYYTDTRNNRLYYQNNIVNVRNVSKYAFCSGSDLLVGGEYLFDEAFSDRTARAWSQNHSSALFVQHDLKLKSRFFATTSVRYSYNDMFGSRFTPDLSVLYKWANFDLRANIARGFRPPTFKELYFKFDHFGWFYIVGNPDLKAETSVFGSVSGEYHSGPHSLSMNFSENRVRDMILEQPVDNSYVYQNVSKATVRTLVVSGRTAIGTIADIWGDVTLVDGKDLEQDNTTLMGVYPWSSRLNVNLKFKMLKSDFSWLLSGRAYSETTKLSFNNLQTIKSPAYQMYRTALTLSKSNLTVSGGVDNLLDYTDFYKQSTYSPGRTYFIKLNYKLKIKE